MLLGFQLAKNNRAYLKNEILRFRYEVVSCYSLLVLSVSYFPMRLFIFLSILRVTPILINTEIKRVPGIFLIMQITGTSRHFLTTFDINIIFYIIYLIKNYLLKKQHHLAISLLNLKRMMFTIYLLCRSRKKHNYIGMLSLTYLLPHHQLLIYEFYLLLSLQAMNA